MAYPAPKICWAVFIGLACLALAVRLPRLGERPMHTDEAVNGYITGQLLAGEAYQYDPKDRHGPALYALALPVARIAGARTLGDLNEAVVRVGPVIVGAATVLGFALLANQVGFSIALFAALLFAIGPLPVYYSRYFIHETLFVGATLGLIFAGGRLLALHLEGTGESLAASVKISRRSSLSAGCLAGLFAALMLACKETAVLHFAGLGAAGLWWWFAARRAGAISNSSQNVCASLAMAGAAALGVFLFVLVGFYTWGGTRWQGLWDLFQAIPHLASRASGEGHEKPAWYYFTLLAGGWSGWPVLILALAGAASSVFKFTDNKTTEPRVSDNNPSGRQRRMFQTLLVYTLVIWVLYSAIPYKTPWLALNLWLPLSLWAGCGFAALWQKARPAAARGLLVAGLCALTVMLGRDTWQRAFAKPADEHNPYAYAHTVEDLLRLPERVAELSRKTSAKNFRIAVVAADPWPLPWYLRKFSGVGFWQPGQDPGAADVYIASPEAAERLESRVQNRRLEFFGVRPEVLIFLWPPPENGSPP